jgi:hypothetical protein
MDNQTVNIKRKRAHVGSNSSGIIPPSPGAIDDFTNELRASLNELKFLWSKVDTKVPLSGLSPLSVLTCLNFCHDDE